MKRCRRFRSVVSSIYRPNDRLGKVQFCISAVFLAMLSPAAFAQYNVIGKDYTLRVAATSSTLAERLRLTQSGLVGVGTQSPTVELEVSGTIKANNFIGDGSSLTNITAASASNADMVDGYHAASFLLKAGDTMTGGLTLNGVGTNGFYNGTGDGASYSTYNFMLKGWFGMGMATYDNTVNGFYDFRSGIWDVKGGYRVNGSPVWYAGNDGAGSGLDADLLDGLDSTAFVKKAGDTMSGNLSINNAAPTISLRDTDNRSAFIYVDGGTFYILNSPDTNGTSWAMNGGYWPLTINLANDDATFGGNVSIPEGTLWMGNARLQNDGNLYMPWAGDWLSNVIGGKLASGGTYGGDNVLTLYGTNPSNDIWSPPLEIREINQVAAGSSDPNYAPGITFHWGGTVANALKMYADGSFRFRTSSTNPAAYANVYANDLWLTGLGDWASVGFMRRYANQWATSSEGNSRFYFSNGGRTYIRANNGDGQIVSFRAGDETDKVHIAQDGNIWTAKLNIWLTDWFNQSVRTDAYPTFKNINLSDVGGWISDLFMRRTVGMWITSSEGQNRFNFVNGGRTYIEAGNNGDNMIATFRNSADADKVHISHDGNIYLAALGNWLTAFLNQAVTTTANPTFNNVYVTALGNWLTSFLNQSVRTDATPSFAGVTVTNMSVTNINGIPAGPQVFRVHKNGTDQAVTAGAWTKMTWSTKEFDTTNGFDTSTGRFTAKVAGYYLITASVYCHAGSTACLAGVYKNGTYVNDGYTRAANTPAATTYIVYMNGSTDYVEIWGFNETGTAILGATQRTYFQGALLR